ncbi:MAG: hypothetical protein HQM11_07960 [SAR324 cluster bacterium]|nr:hypothetical protein [SAR324 cluster bacterium]
MQHEKRTALEIYDFIRTVSGVQTLAEVAKVLGLSPQNLNNTIKRNSIPYEKLFDYSLEERIPMEAILLKSFGKTEKPVEMSYEQFFSTEPVFEYVTFFPSNIGEYLHSVKHSGKPVPAKLTTIYTLTSILALLSFYNSNTSMLIESFLSHIDNNNCDIRIYDDIGDRPLFPMNLAVTHNRICTFSSHYGGLMFFNHFEAAQAIQTRMDTLTIAGIDYLKFFQHMSDYIATATDQISFVRFMLEYNQSHEPEWIQAYTILLLENTSVNPSKSELVKFFETQRVLKVYDIPFKDELGIPDWWVFKGKEGLKNKISIA